MSNLSNGKLTFTVRKSAIVNGVSDTKSALYPSATKQDPIKVIPTTTSTTTTKKNQNNKLPSITKRKRKSPEFAIPNSTSKNRSITQYFTASNRTTINDNDNNSTRATSPFSSKNITTPLSLLSDNPTDNENTICHVRNMHSVEEIWSAIVGEYGEETTLEERIRRVRPRTEAMLLLDMEDQGEELLPVDEEDMGRPVRCRMTIQESLAFFNEITNEFLCA